MNYNNINWINKYKLNFEWNEKFNINKDNWINKYKLISPLAKLIII